MRKFKSITLRELFKKSSGLKRELWGGEFWSNGYYVATVGEGGDWNVVKEYVRKQSKDPDAVQLRLF